MVERVFKPWRRRKKKTTIIDRYPLWLGREFCTTVSAMVGFSGYSRSREKTTMYNNGQGGLVLYESRVS